MTARAGERSRNPFEYEVEPFRVRVAVTAAGEGSGTVRSRDQVVGIGCRIQGGAIRNGTAGCSHTFSDAGGGGTFVLEAAPDAGSTFRGWTGRSSSSGAECRLTFPRDARNVSFSVTARFD